MLDLGFNLDFNSSRSFPSVAKEIKLFNQVQQKNWF